MFLDSIVKQLDQNFADEFCRLRIALFTELGELSSDSDYTELNAATKQYYLSHIKKDLMSWGIFDNEGPINRKRTETVNQEEYREL